MTGLDFLALGFLTGLLLAYFAWQTWTGDLDD